jgi:hypothetical protein
MLRHRNWLQALSMAVVAAASLAGSYSVASAQAVDANLWTTNGPVRSMVSDGGTIYVGGDFTVVGPLTGSGVPFDAATGELPPSFPRVNGSVDAVARDGADGWFIGGQFTSVGGIARNGLAHVAPDLSVSDWNPSPGPVLALALSGSTVYVASKLGFKALDAVTGVAVWSVSTHGGGSEYSDPFSVLAVGDPILYVGGDFTSIGGQARNHIAALDAATGTVTAWNPNANSAVRALAVSGSTVYAAGDFGFIGGQYRGHIAALDAATGAVTAWNPGADMGGNPSSVLAVAVSGTTVYVGGDFSFCGGRERFNIAALDAATGGAMDWSPNANGQVRALAVSGPTVYAGGRFSRIGGQDRSNIAALDATTGAATAWNPDASDAVRTLAVSGSRVYAGGVFNIVGGRHRNRIAALDATTGAATAWDPNADGTVRALTVSGSIVYAVGQFSSIGGQPRYSVAALDAATGAATGWNPNPDAEVRSLAVSGSVIYASGGFYRIGGQRRYLIAALDTGIGAATPWKPDAVGCSSCGLDYVESLAVTGSTVCLSWRFRDPEEQDHYYLTALDAATGATVWSSERYGSVLAANGPTAYVNDGLRFEALDAATGAVAWSVNYSGYGIAVPAVTGSILYVGGTFTSIGGQARNCIAALDAATGDVTAWNPGSQTPLAALATNGSRVFLAGDFVSADGLHYFIDALSNPSTPNAILAFHAEPFEDGVQIVWELSDPSAFLSVTLERAPASTGPWTELSAELSREGESTVALDRSTEAGQTYFYRLIAQATNGSQVVFGPVSASRDKPLAISSLTLKSPNPTPGGIQIEYAVARAGQVRLELLDVSGRVVATLADRAQEPGRYEAAWDGVGPRGQLPPGLYFVRFAAPDRMTVRKLAVVR